MSRRKFNLGDILRKINEQSDETHRSPAPMREEEPARALPLTAPSSPTPLHNGDPEHSPTAELPKQPVYSGTKTGETVNPSGMKSREIPPTHKFNESVDPRQKSEGVGRRHPAETAASDSPRRVSTAVRTPPPPRPQPLAAASIDGDEEEEEFDIYKYIGILLRRKKSIALVAVAATLFSLFRYFSSDKYYIANARLLFRPDDQSIINDQMLFRYWGDREKIFSTHLELLRSYTVLAMVAENLGGKETPEAINASLTIEQGKTGGEKNDIIELSCRHRNAQTARDIVNELCRSYIDYRRNVNAQEITRLISKFEFQIDKLQTELSAKENALREFKESHRMVALPNETNVIITKLADMETALQQTQISLMETRERLSALNTQINSQQKEIVQSVTYHDPFQNRIAALELELNTLASEYSSEHFKVKMLRQQIDNLKAATADSMTREAASRTMVTNPIRQTLLQELVNLSIEKSALDAKRIAQEQLIERLNGELARLPAVEQRFAYLQRETESLLQTLRMLKGKYEEAKIRRDSEESDLKLLELAQTPTDKMSNVTFSSIIVGILVGFILGIAISLLLEYLDQTIKAPLSVEKDLGTPLLGIVPFIEADNALVEKPSDLTKNILEPFRTLRANLKHICATHRLQTFIVCSAVKGEGKTTLASNLGITFALDGKSVILVDGDLRRPQTHILFAVPKQIGLTDYLVGTATIDQIIKRTRFENMSVITSGERTHNPPELLGTVRFDQLIEELKAKADIIIFDSPALLPVSDTITMAPKMDGVLFIVRTFWTPIKAAKQALSQLQRIGSHLYGGILNGASHHGRYYPYYYGYYGYYGYHSYNYADDEDLKRPFSIRETGLRIERSVRERLASFRYAAPKFAAAINRGANTLVRKKTFWLLLLCLLTVTAVRLAVEVFMPVKQQESIIYMGTGADRAKPSMFPDSALGGEKR